MVRREAKNPKSKEGKIESTVRASTLRRTIPRQSHIVVEMWVTSSASY